MGIALGLFALVVLAHLLGILDPRGWTWGVDAYAFLPPAARVAAFGALAAWTFVALRVGGARAHTGPAAAQRPAASRTTFHLALGAAAFALLWTLRARHILLGDGVAVVSELPEGWRFHPLEPLSSAILQLLFRAASTLSGSLAANPETVAWNAAAFGSCLAGAAFAPVALELGRELAAGARERTRGPGGEPDADHDPRGRRAERDGTGAGGGEALFAAGLIASQGLAQVFFGYVEVYAWATLGAALYLWAALRCLRGASTLRAAGLALLLALALHLSAAALLPSFVALAWVAPEPARRRGRARELAIVAGAALGAMLALALAGGGYNLPATLWETCLLIARGARTAPGPLGGLAGLARDASNGQMLLGPLGAALFVPAAVGALARRTGAAPRRAFLLAAGAGALAAALAAGDSNLGYARNWDLLAPEALALTVAGLGLLLARPMAAAVRMRALAVLLGLSLFHTAPWVALNASLDRSLARFQTLPLGLGRVESTLGSWYLYAGDLPRAENWLRRSLDANPANVRAHVHLGDTFLAEGRYVLAVAAFREAVRLRPDRDDYRWRLVDALVRNGALGVATDELRTLAAHDPASVRTWTALGLVLGARGLEPDARHAMESALALVPPGPVLLHTLRWQLDADGARAGLPALWSQVMRL